jgi:hypothetical protein
VQASENLNTRPAQCIPHSVNNAVTTTGSDDDNDDDLPFCDDGDDDNTTPPSTTPTPVVPKPAPTSTAARQQGTPAPAPAPAPPSGNSGSSTVETGGLYVCLCLPYSLPGTYLTLKCDLLLSEWRRRCLRYRSPRHRFYCCHRCVNIPILSNNPVILNFVPCRR